MFLEDIILAISELFWNYVASDRSAVEIGLSDRELTFEFEYFVDRG